MAYSDSEGEDEPFQLARRRKKKKEIEEQAETGDEEKSDEAVPSPSGASSAPTVRHKPRVLRTSR